MPESYAGTATYHANITLPVGTDRRLAKSVRDPLKELGDNTAYLHAQNAGARLTPIEYSLGSHTVFSESTSTFTETTTSFVAKFWATMSNMQVGDKVEALIGPLAAWISGGTGALQIEVSDGSHVTTYAFTFGNASTAPLYLGAIPVFFSVLTAGPVTVNVCLRCNTTGLTASVKILEDTFRWLHVKVGRVAT